MSVQPARHSLDILIPFSQEPKKEKNESVNPIISDSDPVLNYLKSEEALRQVHEEKHSLWFKLHEEIQPMHKKVKEDQFLNALINKPTICTKAVTRYFCNLYVMHKAIETMQIKIENKWGKNCGAFPQLFRSEQLLEDIQNWARFNDLEKTLSKELSKEELLKNIESVAEKSAKEFAKYMETLPDDNLYAGVGAVYALYGTIMSGGQFVRKNLREAYQSNLLIHDLPFEKGSDGIRFFTLTQIASEEVVLGLESENTECYQEAMNQYTQKINAFKKLWHESIDRIPNKINYVDQLIENMAKEANHAMQTVLNFIKDMNLKITC